jgi:hypothetical protein
MTEIAQEAAAELAETGDSNGKFRRECEPIHPDCECGWESEIQGNAAGVGRSSEEVVEDSMRYLLEVDGTSSSVFLDPDNRRLGIGVVVSGDEVVFSFDFPR